MATGGWEESHGQPGDFIFIIDNNIIIVSIATYQDTDCPGPCAHGDDGPGRSNFVPSQKILPENFFRHAAPET